MSGLFNSGGDENKVECDECGGTGKYECNCCPGIEPDEDCPMCGGTGISTCGDCGGTGKVDDLDSIG